MNLKQAMKKAKKTGEPQVVLETPTKISVFVRYGAWVIRKRRMFTKND